MSCVLVVEDSPDQALQIRSLLEAAGWRVRCAENGRAALEEIERGVPQLVVTDLRMPEMNGLELVEAVSERYPRLPVILIPAYGNEDIAVEALQKGALSYIPKKRLADDLVDTVRHVAELVQCRQERNRVLQSLERARHVFALENDIELIAPLVRYMEEMIEARFADADAGHAFKAGVALSEAIANAMHHGNLEVDSELRESDYSAYQSMVHRRRQEAPYRDRRVHVTAELTEALVRYRVRDEGPGFAIVDVPSPTDPSNLLKLSGRGLFLISTFMDQVAHNERGNEITMEMRFGSAEPPRT